MSENQLLNRQCSNCMNWIPAEARVCPVCQHPLSQLHSAKNGKPSRLKQVGLGVIGFFLLCGIVSAIGSQLGGDGQDAGRGIEAAPTFTSTAMPQPVLVVQETPTDPLPTDTPVSTNPPIDTSPQTTIPTDVPLSTNPPADTPTPAPVTNGVANLRGGPGTEFPVVGSADAGALVAVVSKNAAGDWYQLADGTWIAAFLVDNPPDVGVAAVIPPLPVQAVVEATPTSAPDVVQPTVASNPQAFTCADGCATPPDASCAIKGNVNSQGERIYHVPGGQSYSRTDIKPEEGDRWFCTSAEAQSAGFRASER